MAVRAIRGATRVLVDGAVVDDREHVLASSRELVRELIGRNELSPDDLISIIFTATADLASVAPALAARQLGLHDVALICAQEMVVGGSMTGVVRLLAHVETDRPRAEIQNVYLNGTEVLRQDVPAIADPGPR